MHIFKFIPQILIVLFLIFTSESVAEETYIQRTLKRASRESRTISAIVRDMPADLKEFEMDTSNSVVIPNMVDTVLGADGKIRKGVVNFYSTNIESWFETINFGGGKVTIPVFIWTLQEVVIIGPLILIILRIRMVSL